MSELSPETIGGLLESSSSCCCHSYIKSPLGDYLHSECAVIVPRPAAHSKVFATVLQGGVVGQSERIGVVLGQPTRSEAFR